MATLKLSNIVKRFDQTTVIHDLDLAVDEGEFVVFVGPSGCGKSTLLRMIAGLEAPSAGAIQIDGKTVNQVSAAHRGCAMVFQSYALYPHMTVFDNMAFGLENLGVPKAQIQSKVQQAAAMLRLDTLLLRKPTQLSGGQRQRVAIGRAIVREPKLFLFDEPLSNLDAELRVSMRAEIRELHTKLKATMIYVTHDQVEAMTLADKIVVLRAGKIEQIGSPLDLYNAPCNTFVAGFIGSPRMNFIPKEALAETTALGLKDGVHTVGIRPEHVQIQQDSALQMSIEQIEQLGASSLLLGSIGALRLEVLMTGQTSLKAGEKIGLQLPAPYLHCFDRLGERLN